MRLPRLFGRFFVLHLKRHMQYKLSFFLLMLSRFLLAFAVLASMWFMMSRFHMVDGFTLPQVMLGFAVVQMGFSLAEALVRGFDMFPRMISNGEFDRALVRPRSSIFMVLVSDLEFTRIGGVIQAVMVLVYALPRSGVQRSAGRVLCVIFMLAGGFLVFSGLFMLRGCFAFFTIEGLEFMNILVDGGREFGQYPYAIYGKWVLRFLTLVVPLALVQYWPLLYLLGQRQNIAYMLLPLLAGLFLVPVYLFWRFGLRRYKSTGS